MITVTDFTWHHTEGQPADIWVGMSARDALAALRFAERDSFGDLGAGTINLSDGTWIDIDLTPASDGGCLMASQRITRMRWAKPYERGFEYVMRRYNW